MNYRQVHLDFHTSEKIEGIGKDFSKEQFQHALKIGHVDSITLFSKCHHGWAYHPSDANEIHPHLDFDLLGAEIEAAHEIGVKTPVYLSAGLDEKMARRHPEWLIRRKDESTLWAPNFSVAGYHRFCFNSPYLDYLLAQIKEVCERYDADGIFLDIVGVVPCYCQNCVKTLLDEGKDPYNDDDANDLAERIYANYCRRVRETIDSVKPGLPVFHNGGHIIRGRRDLAHFNTHLELESLPTGGWGYDHFPLSAAYSRTLGMEFLGMTGKFHKSWGDFGGFKHPNAIRYEVALSAANGAKCSIGDQMHPSGKMEENTYHIIGAGYSELEATEEWLRDADFVTDIAVLSAEAFSGYQGTTGVQGANSSAADAGAVRILLEGKYLFNVIDTEEDFGKYKVIILPDSITPDKPLADKLRAFISDGGKILATGKSGVDAETESEFIADFGAKFIGKAPFDPDYFKPSFEIPEYLPATYVMKYGGYSIEADGEVLGLREDSYFNRSVFSFSSHNQTPNKPDADHAGMTEGKDGICISWNVFTEYADLGSLICKRMVEYALDRLLGDNKTVSTNLPAQGIVTLTQQSERLVFHALYASPVKRGMVEVVEDIVPVHDVEVAIKTDKKIKGAYLAPERKPLAFEQTSDCVRFTIPKLENHAIVVLDF